MPPIGFLGALTALGGAAFGAASSDTPIHYDEMSCHGNEQALSQCSHRPEGLHDCTHDDDASVVCQGLCACVVHRFSTIVVTEVICSSHVKDHFVWMTKCAAYRESSSHGFNFLPWTLSVASC